MEEDKEPQKTEIVLSVIQKVKNALDITDDFDALTLYDLLYDARNNSHPDKYSEETKDEAEEKFKKLNQLLNELKIYIDQERLNKKPSEITLYQDRYNLIQIKKHSIDLEEANEKQKKEIDSLKLKINDNIDSKEEVNLNNLKEAQSDLEKLYIPKKSKFILISLNVVFIIFLNIATKINSLKEKLIDIFPFESKYLNFILFGILIIITINFVINRIKLHKVKRISEELISPRIIKEFYTRYKKEGPINYYKSIYFTESDVTEFIGHQYSKRRYLKSLAYYIEDIFVISDDKSINHLRDI